MGAMLDIMDMLDTHTPMDTMERDLLMLSQRLMLIPISCTEDMALATLDIMDMLDTHTYGYYGKRYADAALLYGAYGYGLGYRTYGYGYPYAYGAYGYYGKRSADAEPKADADAAYLYGGYYGYARPYAYGYRSYGYPYWG